MQYGLQFNAKFGGVREFERTKEFSVFELLGINIVHGWLADPSDKQAHKFIAPLSYDSLMDKICLARDLKEKESHLLTPQEKKDSENGTQGELFIQQSASQLTFEGLIQLHKTLKDNELCVFFRNNHFSTMLKRERESGGKNKKKESDLFLLVTDEGYANKPNVVWEKLSEVGGDTVFVDSHFLPSPLSSPFFPDSPSPPFDESSVQQQLQASE